MTMVLLVLLCRRRPASATAKATESKRNTTVRLVVLLPLHFVRYHRYTGGS
jgi:hypothetical protein